MFRFIFALNWLIVFTFRLFYSFLLLRHFSFLMFVNLNKNKLNNKTKRQKIFEKKTAGSLLLFFYFYNYTNAF
jgi:hypothetical protein